MSEYSIRELEKLSGIKAHTIRIWEKRYNLVCPRRTSTNIRYYSDDDLKKLLNISILNKQGLKISKIACLKNDELTSQVNSVVRESWNYETQIENMLLAMIDLNEKKFEKLLSKCIIQMGFEETILKVIYPFFNRLGLLWQIGNVNPAQEHFISNLVRQKVIVAIDGVIPLENLNPSKIIMFLPEGELHELALLFLFYMLKKRGHKIIYLGQTTPVCDVRSIQDIYNADYIITYYTSLIHENILKKQLEEMSVLFNECTLIIGGSQTETINNFKIRNITRAANPEDLLKLLDNNVLHKNI